VSDRGPDFDDLVGEDLQASERDRLHRVHDALVAAGPPPELGNRLAEPPVPSAEVVRLGSRRRRRVALVALAAALAIGVFAGGFATGSKHARPEAVKSISMTGTSLAGNANASLDLFTIDAAGNWPMKLSVAGLAPSADRRPYELWLTRGGKLVALCGSFVPKATGTTTVPMNAPYKLTEYDGWVVVEEGSTAPILTTA
jgi:hypothetical protein